MIPVAVEDPRSGGHRPGKRADAPDELRLGPGVTQLHRLQRKTPIGEVHVRVREPGNDHRPPGIDDTRPPLRELPDLAARPDRRDVISLYRDRVGPWVTRVTGPDAGIDDGKADHGGLGEHMHVGLGVAVTMAGRPSRTAAQRRSMASRMSSRISKYSCSRR